MTKRTAGSVVAGLAAALLLSACGGGGDDAKPDTIDGAGKADDAASASAGGSKAKARQLPELDFPDGTKVVIDADTTGDKAKDALLRDHAYAVQTIELAYAKSDARLPELKKHVVGEAGVQWRANIAEYEKNGRATTGSPHYYKRKPKLLKGGQASVRYCLSQRDTFDKDVKTGKTYRTKPSDDDFVSIYDRLKKGQDGTWQIFRTFLKRGDSQCAV